MPNNKTKTEIIKTDAVCTSVQDSLITVMTESFPFIHWNRYIASYKYQYQGKCYCKKLVFKKRYEDGELTWCHPFEIELTFNSSNPKKAKWNHKKV